MVFSNKFVSFIYRSYLYLICKILIVFDDVYLLGVIVIVCCVIKEWINFFFFLEVVYGWLVYCGREVDNDCSRYCLWRIR